MTTKHKQYTKFSPYMAMVKYRAKEARLDAGLSMKAAAAKLGVSVKQLEDFETLRNYGANLPIELLVIMGVAYGVPLLTILGPFPNPHHSPEAYIRPRRRIGSKNRKK